MAIKSGKKTGVSAVSPLSGEALHQRIAEKAYELYRSRGQRHGDDLKDWYEAEQLVLTEQRPQAQTKAPSARTSRRIAGRDARLETGQPP
jgi:hypothetical protein